MPSFFAEAMFLAELKQAVLSVQSGGQEQLHQEAGQYGADACVDYVSVEEAAKRLNMSRRRVRYICSKGRIAGAHMENDDLLIPLATLKSIKIYNERLAD